MTISDLNKTDINTVESILDILEENEDSIEENYNEREDLVALNKTIKDKILKLLKTVKISVDKKELVKFAIREYFELQERDIVVIREDKIIIKLLDEESIHEVSKEEQGTIAGRYNGINENDLESFYHDIFLQEESEDFFYFVANNFVQEHLIAKRLDNKTYEQTVFPTIQAIITKKLIENFDHNEEFFKGFSGYVFRIHFKEVFDYIADIILNKLAQSNDYIINFLKYYSLSVVIVNGKRYRVPAIEAEDGWKWNVASMIPVIKVFIKADDAVYRLENEINALKEKTTNLHIHGLSPVAYNLSLNKEIDKIRQDIIYEVTRLDAHVLTLKDDPLNKKLKQEISDIRKTIQNMRNKVKQLEDKLITKEKIIKYSDLKRDLDSKIRYKEREEQVLKNNEKSFNSIADALVKALSSKKVLIG